MVNKTACFTILQIIGCPSVLLCTIPSFYDGLRATVTFEDMVSDPFEIQYSVKQGFVPIPTLFGCFCLSLNEAFLPRSIWDIWLCTRLAGSFFSLARLSEDSYSPDTRTSVCRWCSLPSWHSWWSTVSVIRLLQPALNLVWQSASSQKQNLYTMDY